MLSLGRWAVPVRLTRRDAFMRRLLSVAFLSASLVVLSSAFAQHAGFGGGHAGSSFGGHVGGGTMGHVGGGFSGGAFGRSSGFASPIYTAPNFVSTAPTHAVSTAPGHAIGLGYRPSYIAPAPAWRREGGGDHGRDRDFRYRSPYRGYGGYPYVYASPWLPWDLSYPDTFDYDSGSDAQQQATSAVAPDEGYRPDYEGTAEPPYPYPPQPPPDEPVAAQVAPEPALTLVFNDGHQETIHNYVLTSGDVIVLDEAGSGRQKRIPLASLNLDATEQAAQQAGLDFTPPA